MKKAIRLYEAFHSFPPRDVGRFKGRFVIPTRAWHAGDARMMYYSSDKLNPTTKQDEGLVSYYHEHKPGVAVYVPSDRRGRASREIVDGPATGPVEVPTAFRKAQSLVRLGRCDGFDFCDLEGNELEARPATDGLAWYCTPDGRMLCIVAGLRRVVLMCWGGRLGVIDRGVIN